MKSKTTVNCVKASKVIKRIWLELNFSAGIEAFLAIVAFDSALLNEQMN